MNQAAHASFSEAHFSHDRSTKIKMQIFQSLFFFFGALVLYLSERLTLVEPLGDAFRHFL